MRKARENIVGTRLMQCLGNLAYRAAGVTHIVDYQTILATDVADDIHYIGLVRSLTTFVAKSEAGVEPLCVGSRTLRTTSIRSDDDQILDRIRLETLNHNRRGV